MSHLENAYYDLGRLDLLADKDTRIHRLDPRVKVASTIVFIVYVVSFDRYEITGLLPFFLFPALLVALADLPPGYLFRKILLVSPFVFCIGIFNPLLDNNVIMQVGPLQVAGGWLSLISLLLRFVLTVGAGLLLISTTGFPALCMALEKMGTPKIFTVQLLMLYRYLFVLVEESIRMFRAYTLRTFTGKNVRLHIFRQMLGSLLLRTLDRAQRIHMAMLSRAFTGEIRVAAHFGIGAAEIFYLALSTALLTLFRFVDIAGLLGKLILEAV